MTIRSCVRCPSNASCLILAALAVTFAFAASARFAAGEPNDSEQAPLYQRVDSALAEARVGAVASISTDHEFVRRVHIDLIGRSPRADETKAFLADADPQKRGTLVDRLLDSDEFSNFFAGVLDIMLMERRNGNRVAHASWVSFLRSAIAENQPFDQLVQTMLSADGNDESRGPAKFLLEREVEPNAVTRDVARMFLGRDLQCAQCHDHPAIADYTQAEYYGIYAFVSRSYLFEIGPQNKKKAYVGEKADGHTEFKSVFFPDEESSRIIPTLLGGLQLDVEPRLEGEDPYVVKPSKQTAATPKFSRRAQLARLITHPANAHFAKNWVNRLWAHMLGRGLVDPVDFHHSDNPPSHPGLLKMLADEFVASGFDYRLLLGQIARSQAYQRAVDFPTNFALSTDELESSARQLETQIAELESSTTEAEAEPFQQRLELSRGRLDQLDEKISVAAGRLSDLQKKRAEVGKARDEQNKKLADDKQKFAVLNAAVSAAKKAAEALPKDEALRKSLALVQEKSEKFKQKVEAAQATLEQNKKEADEVAGQLEVEQRRLAQLKSDRIGAADMVAEDRGALRVFTARVHAEQALLEERRQRSATISLHHDYLAKQRERETRRQRLAELEASPSGAGEELARLEKSLAEAEQQLRQQRQSNEQLAGIGAASAERLSKQEAGIAALSQAVVTATAAREQFADGELDAAIAALRAKQAELESAAATTNEQMKLHAERAAAADSLLKQKIAARDKLAADKASAAAQVAEHEAQLEGARAAAGEAEAEWNLAGEQLRQSWERRFAVRALVPLSPEQLAGSTVAALELDRRFRRAAENKWETDHKDKKPEEIDADKKAAEIEAAVRKGINQITNTYISLYAAPAASPQDVFSATADQALFWGNDGRVQGWLRPASGSLVHRLQSLKNLDELAAELYLAILCRSATDAETKRVADYLTPRQEDRGKAIGELAWGLMSSLEFRFNH